MSKLRPVRMHLLYTSVFLISFTIITYQITLIRAFSYTGYYHFSYLIISLALLGFGASGTLVNIFRDKIKHHFHRIFTLIFFSFIFSIPLCYLASQHIPFDIQYLFYSTKQLFFLLATLFLLTLPFLTGAMLTGILLLIYPLRIKALYGFNLLGSGAGGIGALLLLEIVLPETAPLYTVLLPCAGFFAWAGAVTTPAAALKRWLLPAGLILGLLPVIFFVPFNIEPGQYKSAAYLKTLEKQGNARKILTTWDAASRLDLYSSRIFHNTLFASLANTAPPPPQLALLLDGQMSASLFLIDDPGEAAIMGFTPQSLVYRLTKKPGVLLLDDEGGTSAWLAALFKARKITNVIGDKKTAALQKHGIPAASGEIAGSPENLEVINVYPRLFLEETEQKYDIIHISGTEAIPSSSGGMHSLQENYLLTVESVEQALRRLNKGGFLSVTRGLQHPPRDNLKIFGLFKKALEKTGVREPGQHLFQARNYLAATTIMAVNPFTRREIDILLASCRELVMDIEYHPGIISKDIRQVNKIPGPPGTPYSYYHQGAMEILGGQEKRFFNNWLFRVTPPTDDSPYFSHFFKWKIVPRFNNLFGAYWFRKVELGFPVLLATFILITLLAFLLILAPLTGKNIKRIPPRRGLFFVLIGFGFMFFEISFIQKFIKYLGNPVYSTAVVISSMLFFAGAGSLSQKWLSPEPAVRIRRASLLVAALQITALFLLDPIMQLTIQGPPALRFFISVLILSPLSYFPGIFLSAGMEIIKKENASIPLAWGINGFASVAASPLALILSMWVGFRFVLLLASGLYLLCGVIMRR